MSNILAFNPTICYITATVTQQHNDCEQKCLTAKMVSSGELFWFHDFFFRWWKKSCNECVSAATASWHLYMNISWKPTHIPQKLYHAKGLINLPFKRNIVQISENNLRAFLDHFYYRTFFFAIRLDNFISLLNHLANSATTTTLAL